MVDVAIKGTAFTTDAAAGDWFHRTDLILDAGYDGTQWLSDNKYSIEIPQATFTTDGNASFRAVLDSNAIYYDLVSSATNTATTCDSDNYWTISVTSASRTLSDSDVILSFNTGQDTADTWTDHDATPSDQTPTNYGNMRYSVAATGTPGNLQVILTAYYREILT